MFIQLYRNTHIKQITVKCVHLFIQQICVDGWEPHAEYNEIHFYSFIKYVLTG